MNVIVKIVKSCSLTLWFFLHRIVWTTHSIKIAPNGVTSIPEAVKFYNAFGRFLFMIHQIIALITKNKIFKRKIVLEHFEGIDYENLYGCGCNNIIWPRPPLFDIPHEIDGNPQDLINRLQLSYKISYESDTKRFPHSKWWDEMSNEFREAYFNDNGNINIDGLKNFRGRYTSKAAILRDQLERIFPKKGYFYSYLRSLQLVLDYHRMSNLVDHTTLLSVSESFVGNNLPCLPWTEIIQEPAETCLLSVTNSQKYRFQIGRKVKHTGVGRSLRRIDSNVKYLLSLQRYLISFFS